MTISIAIPSNVSLNTNPNSDTLGLYAFALSAAAGVSLPDANTSSSTASSLAVLSSGGALALPSVAGFGDGTAPGNSAAASGLDPLTPQGHTASAAAALSSVISSVTSALGTVKAGNGTGELLQSSGFQLLLQLLGSNDVTGSVTGATAGGLLAGTESSAKTGATGPISSGGAAGEPAPYFQKLLGELESTYKSTAPSTTQASATFDSSELDLFLKWLSLNGSNSVVASA